MSQGEMMVHGGMVHGGMGGACCHLLLYAALPLLLRSCLWLWRRRSCGAGVGVGIIASCYFDSYRFRRDLLKKAL